MMQCCVVQAATAIITHILALRVEDIIFDFLLETAPEVASSRERFVSDCRGSRKQGDRERQKGDDS
ncbi:MAG TPA: hypothetical protein VK451_11100, partial [Methyloceanibacter sp.]|nr:hypothetical protein [Methyloceanibacter sp.]